MAPDIEDSLGGQSSPSSPQELYNALYASCASHPDGTLFDQEQLLFLNVIPGNDLAELMRCLNRLAKDQLFKIMTKDGKPCWKVVKKEEAEKYRGLTTEDAMIYAYVESAGREGIWTRTIRARTNVHQAVLSKCLKSLESKGLIKPIQSAKYPKRKIYILAKLQPSEEVTGGAFYTDGVLDEEFVHQLGILAEKYISAKSWYHSSSKSSSKKKSKSKLTSEEAQALRAQELNEALRDRPKVLLPMPPGYTGYPTVPEITRAINDSGLSSVVMMETEIRQLLDILCWSGRIMKVSNGQGYRSVRPTYGGDGSVVESSLTEAPCGRCPVFDLCDESGPVNARTCKYFQDWLGA